MPGKVIFREGEPKELEGRSIIDRRLINRLGQRVRVLEQMKPEPSHLVVYIKDEGIVYGKLAVVRHGETRTGDELNLPLVENVSHIPNKEIM